MNNSKLLLAAAFCFLFGGMFLTTLPLIADDSDTIYGKGVHAFFDRHYDEAVKILSEVENLKSADPRPYYFLGLAYLQQKKHERADQSFKKAAELEFSGRAARDYAVSESLRRIQGTERQRIERIRAEERINAQKQAQRLQEKRYGEKNAADREILRQSSPQTQKKDLAALQKISTSFSGNTFGAKPIDPMRETEEIITVQRTGNNPFGEIKTNADTLPEIIAIKPVDRSKIAANVASGGQGNTDEPLMTSVSPARQAQAAAAKELGKGLRSFFININKVEPKVVTLEPAHGAADVDAAAVKELRVTFDVDMNTESHTWFGSGETYPKTTGDPKWIDARTCTLPVELEPGKIYLLGINAPNSKGFQSKEGIPVAPVPYKFSTQ